MTDESTNDDDVLAAGDISLWVAGMQAAIRGEQGSDVPCNGCTACCTSRQFIHIGPDETDTLSRIPAALLFPAPRMPRGHVLLGYDDRGHCPMLIDNRCSIYEHRPVTCRTYDCRVFAAAGIEVDDDQAPIGRQARRWRFDAPTQAGRDRLAAIRSAAASLAENKAGLPEREQPKNATQRAVLAVEIHESFLPGGERSGIDPDEEMPRWG